MPTAPLPVHHPMIDTPARDVADQVANFSPSGTLTEPLPEHVQYFEKLIDDANRTNPLFHGADYKEFVDSKFDIDDITDEVLKYKTAYNVLKGTGLTRDKLLLTGQEYMNLIGRDMNAFQGAFAMKYSREVRPKEAVVQKKAEELQALVQRMNALKAEINQLTQEVNLTKDKLTTTKASFLLAGEKKQNEIEAELQKIAQYF
jgi:archaellum component FlaC